MNQVVCKVNVEMGIQQSLNYVLFRADQIVLAIMGLKLRTNINLDMYVFMAKFPELLSGVMLIAGAVLFPKIFIRYPFNFQDILNTLRKYSFVIAGYFIVVLLTLCIYTYLWKGENIPGYLLGPFLIHSLSIVLVNNITYSALRQGFLRRLLVNLSFSVLAGLFFSIYLFTNFTIGALSWVVPAQLLLFITMSLVIGWGQSRELYSRGMS